MPDRINVIAVPSCRPTETGTKLNIETDHGEHIELSMTPEAFRQWSQSCTCPDTATDDRVNVVHVSAWRATGDGADMEFETAGGERLGLTMTSEALTECAAKCMAKRQIAPEAVKGFTCEPGPEHVLVTLACRGDGAASEFMLSHGDAVLLSVQLLQAAKDARSRAPQG